MAKQIIMWTALPNGIVDEPSGRRLRLSVFVSPRLQTDGEDGVLSSFRDFHDWPSHLQPGEVSFVVQVAGADPVFPTIISPPPKSSLWRALFAPSTQVRSHQFDDLTGRPIQTYSAASIHDHTKNSYQKVSTNSPVHLPNQAVLEQAFPLHGAFLRAAGRQPVAAGLTPQVLHNQLAEDLFRIGPETDLSTNIARAVTSAKELAKNDPRKFTEVIQDNGTEDSHFAQLAAFHHRKAARTKAVPPKLDFHQAVTALGEYPELLRRLGLVIDFEVPAAGFTQSLSTQSPPRLLQIIPTFTAPLSSTNYIPFTAYIREGNTVFLPASRPAGKGPETFSGFLNLEGPEQYKVIQVDVDGAGLKTINMVAGQIAPQKEGTVDPLASPTGVPAFRTSGVWIARADHARTLHERINTARDNQPLLESDPPPPQPVTFFNEDLIRGFRVDVKDDQSDWHSLHQRQGTYMFKSHEDGPLTLSIADEGTTQPALTQELDDLDGAPDPHSPLYVHDSLFHWQGWSLAAPRPGKAVTPDGPGVVVNTAPPDGFPLEVTFAVEPGSLPRLRFGGHYQFRARSVDLAGNCLSLDEAAKVFKELSKLDHPALVLPKTANEFLYRRFEPVPSPVLVAREKFTEGESLECLVIRSNRGQSATAYATQLGALVAFRKIYRGFNDRHVVPPKSPLCQAEMHGLLDDSFGTRPGETKEQFEQRCARTYHLAQKEKGQLSDVDIIDITTGKPLPIPPTVGIDPQTGASISRPSVEFIPTNVDPINPNRATDPGYAVHHEEQLRLPYLPDPFARGAALFGLPGLQNGQSAQVSGREDMSVGKSLLSDDVIKGLRSTTEISFTSDDDWPELQPFRLEVIESDGRPLRWDKANRVLTVPLEQAEQATVRLSSFLNPGDLLLLGMWEWMKSVEGLPPASPVTIQTARAGALWMLTPFREITLVHAVQQPLTEPRFLFLEQRLSQALAPIIEELTAAVGEGADFGISLPLPAEVLASDHGRTCALLMGEIQVDGKSTMKLDLMAHWREPADQREEHWPTASAQVSELSIHLPGATPVERELPRALLPLKPGMWFVPASDEIQSSDKVQFSFLRHEFSDTKHRKVVYQAIGTTRFREYFPLEVTKDPNNLSRSSQEVEINILSSARPAVPQVRYVLPTFAWRKSTDDETGVTTSERFGGGVRVYLDRPWFSSGEGELLGVVMETDAAASPNHLLQPYVTHWGRDPIWESNPTFRAPSPINFKNAVKSQSGLKLDEVPGASTVTVVGHAVDFDENRKLWFCDIEIDAGESYFPFVRLALARYQPHSIENTHLSSVVETDFVQLAPNRTVTLSPDPDNADSFTVKVEGLTYRANGWRWRAGINLEPQQELLTTIPEAPDLIQVSVEERMSGTNDEAGWQPHTRGPAVQIDVTSVVDAGNHPDPRTPLWLGRVILPNNRTPAQFRVVIKEIEHFLTDKRNVVKIQDIVPDNAILPPNSPLHPGDTFTITQNYYPGAERLVFADTIEL